LTFAGLQAINFAMCDEMITLWTVHSPDFDIRAGKVDHSKSEYYLNTPGVKEVYHELWRRLNTPKGQIIWCYTEYSDIAKTGIKKVMWELQIPLENVVCFIDDLVWNRILGIRCNVGRTLRRKWQNEAIEKCPSDSHFYFKKCEEDFWNRKPKTGSCGMNCLSKTPVKMRVRLYAILCRKNMLKRKHPGTEDDINNKSSSIGFQLMFSRARCL